MTTKVMAVHVGGNKRVKFLRQTRSFNTETQTWSEWETRSEIDLYGPGAHTEEYVYDSQRIVIEESTQDILK